VYIFCLALVSVRYTPFLRERFHYNEGCTIILEFPDDSSGERTRYAPINKKQDGPS